MAYKYNNRQKNFFSNSHEKNTINDIIVDGYGIENSLINTSHSILGSYSEKPISNAYSTIDNDLARDNMENDIPYADLQDL